MPAARTQLALTLAAALALTPVAAFAQTPEEREQAGAYYKAGAEAYFKEDFAQAIINFKAGYDLDPNPMFLYNLSLSYAKLGNLDEALVQAYAAEEMGGLDPQTSAKNRARIRSYEVRLQAGATAEAIAAPPAGCVSDDDCGDAMVCEADTGECVEAPEGPEEPSESFVESIPLSTIGWAGAGVATLGLGLIVGGLVVDAGLDDDLDRYNRYVAEERLAEARALKDEIDGTQDTGVALLYLGIVSFAAGGGMVAYDLFFDEDGAFTDAALIPSVGPDAASVKLRLRF